MINTTNLSAGAGEAHLGLCGPRTQVQLITTRCLRTRHAGPFVNISRPMDRLSFGLCNWNPPIITQSQPLQGHRPRSDDPYPYNDSHWVRWRLGLFDSNQLPVGLLGSVGRLEL